VLRRRAGPAADEQADEDRRDEERGERDGATDVHDRLPAQSRVVLDLPGQADGEHAEAARPAACGRRPMAMGSTAGPRAQAATCGG
jgi:hypothetical protein